ncbi:aminotransferase class I/II-fold pyridoxal phosphate-dependent enzyme [Algivirga pacifica]|uniref:Aminotransferase class I/classII large domain-containing protein n=1 Tax=Algivirga pacifica TaxID=1162670 RepID=A0ABP9DB60_9BACT
MHFDTNKISGRSILQQGQENLYFGGTAYLGLDVHTGFRGILMEGFSRYGHYFGASRLGNLRLDIYDQFERFFAELMYSEDSLVVSSGTLAAQLFVQAYSKDMPRFYVKGTHPCLYQPEGNIFLEADQHGAAVINAHEGPVTIFCNAVDPLFCQPIDFEWLHDTDPTKEITLVVDASHAFGVADQLLYELKTKIAQLYHIKLVLLGSLGKAYSLPAGIILADRNIIDTLKGNPLFGGSSPAAPGFLHAFIHAMDIIRQQQSLLSTNLKQITKESIIQNHFQTLKDYPVFAGKKEAMAAYLQQNNIVISSFHYPTATSPLLNRIVINATHTASDLDYLMEKLEEMEKVKSD